MLYGGEEVNFEHTDVWGFMMAIQGMRNPFESWCKSDTLFVPYSGGKQIKIGSDDLSLMQNLITLGDEHSKFMRMIHVIVDITAPRYWWSEFDTYHHNTKNSTSTMHRLLSGNKELTYADFVDFGIQLDSYDQAIKDISELKKIYKTANNNSEILRIAKAILPEGYLQMRTVDTNYAELRNIYFQRKNHRLPEWSVDFVEWVKTLPYSDKLITFERSDAD